MFPQDPGAPDPTPEPHPASEIPSMPGTTPAAGDAWSMSPSKRRRHRWPWILAAMVAILLVGGGATAFVLLRGSSEELLSKIPAQSDVVAVAYLNPSAGQKVNLLRLANHFPPLGSTQKIRDQVNKALDSMLSGVGLDHTDTSWVGSEVAVTVDFQSNGRPQAAFLLATADEGAARATTDKLHKGSAGADLTWTTEDHGGVKVSIGSSSGAAPGLVYAVFDGVAVIGNSPKAVEDVIDTDQGKLAALNASAEFQTTMADLPTGKLGFLYMDPSSITRNLRQNPAFQTGVLGPSGSNLEALKGVALTVSAQSDGLQIDASTRYDPSKLSADQRARLTASGRSNPLLDSVPSNAYGIISLVGLDKSLKAALNQGGALSMQQPGLSDLVDSLSGDLVVEASPGGSGTPGGAIIIGSKNDAMMQSSLDQLASAIPGFFAGARWKTQAYAGATVRHLAIDPNPKGFAPGAPYLSPAYAVVHGEVIIGSSIDAVHRIIDVSKGGPNISSSPAFIAASKSVPAGGTLFFLDVHRIVSDVRGLLPPDMRASFDKGAGQYLDPVQWVASGSESDSSHDRQRVFIRIS